MFTYQFSTRYYEADPMGIIHHSEYIRYFELGRDRWMESLGYGLRRCQDEGLTFPVAELRCRYRHPLHFGETVTVTVEVRSFGGAKIVIDQQVLNEEGVLCAEGSVTLGFLDSATGHIRRCPDALAKLFETQLNN